MKQDNFIPQNEVSSVVVAAQNGNKAALEKIVQTHQKFVYSVAKKFGFLGRDFETQSDILLAGNEGLLNAVKRFDPNRGASFLRCAEINIKASIIECVSSFQAIHLPKEKSRALNSVKKLINESNLESVSQEKKISYIAKKASLSEEEVKKILTYEFSFTSITQNSSTDEFDITEKQEICEEKTYVQNAEDFVLKDEVVHLTQTALLSISSREQFVLRKYYGFDGECFSLSEIGKSLGLTKQRVLQIKIQAEKKLSSIPYLQNLVA